MKRNFSDVMGNLKETISGYNWYVDFNKVQVKVDEHKFELNIINALIGSMNIEKDFSDMILRYPETLNALPILLAIRLDKTPISVLDDTVKKFDFKKQVQSIDEYCKFMRETGLFDLFENKKIKNIMDYVTGIEVGMDSNARKNRTGTAMENKVESYLQKIPNLNYCKEMNKKKIKTEFNIDLDDLLEGNTFKANKRFDFVVKTNETLYVIETNFYSGGGSKLNETARSFKMLGQELRDVKGVKFIWITDGVGWKTAKANLQETYEVLEHLYTIYDLDEGILTKIFK